jgi:hypothetical protein
MTKEEILGTGKEAWDFSHDRTVVIERDDALVAMDEYAKSWRDRCLAAEDFIAKSPSDPDITEEQMKAYEKWQRIVEGNPDTKDELAEYAKQQAIAFSNWQEEGCYLYNTNPNGWCRLNENFETEDVCETTEQLYDQFIESQNKTA